MEEVPVGRHGAPPVACPVEETVTCSVVVRVSGSADSLSVTIRVTTTVDGFPSIQVVEVVVMVVGEFPSADVPVVGSGVADALGIPVQIVQCLHSKNHFIMPSQGLLHLHPTPWHTYPGIQQPPPSSAGQLLASVGQSPTEPSQVAPSGQQATFPTFVSETSVQ